MGAVLGCIFGLGIVLVLWSLWYPRVQSGAVSKPIRLGYIRRLLISAGLPEVSSKAIWFSCLILWLCSFLVVYVLTRTWSIALIVATPVAGLPLYLLQSKANKRVLRLAQLWPDVIDDILAGVRSGMSLPDILIQLGKSGPQELQPDFAAFTSEYRAHGRFYPALEVLRWRLDSVDASRLIEVLRLTHEVGGTDIGVLLRELAVMIRADLRTRGEIAARQSWTANAARLAVISPWVVLLMIATRTEATRAYATAQGTGVLLGGLLVSVFAYWLMLRLGRLSVRG